MSSLIELRGLTKRFAGASIAGKTGGLHGSSGRRGFLAVKGVDLEIPAGAIYGLVGESGCGKTTLARTVLQLEAPTSGSVRFGGIELTTLGRADLRRLRRRMQIVFQDPNGALNPRLSVRASLSEGLRNLGKTRTEIDRIVDEAAASVGIPPSHLARKPRELSGGQKQRLVIARALTMEPEFLVLDEPVSNLDVSVQAQIINLLIDLRERFDLTYLFISHDLNLVAWLCDYVAVMYNGRIVEIGTADQIIEEPLHLYTRTLFNSLARVVDHENLTPPLQTTEELQATAHRSERRGRSSTHAALPTGCAFSSVCDRKSSRCLSGEPAFLTLGPQRGVACFEAKTDRVAK